MASLSTTERMAKMSVDAAKSRMGAGWSVLSEELQGAMIALEALRIISQNSDNAGWERAAALADAVLQGTTSTNA